MKADFSLRFHVWPFATAINTTTLYKLVLLEHTLLFRDLNPTVTASKKRTAGVCFNAQNGFIVDKND